MQVDEDVAECDRCQAVMARGHLFFVIAQITESGRLVQLQAPLQICIACKIEMKMLMRQEIKSLPWQPKDRD